MMVASHVLCVAQRLSDEPSSCEEGALAHAVQQAQLPHRAQAWRTLTASEHLADLARCAQPRHLCMW